MSYKNTECTKTTKREKSVAFSGIASADVDTNLACSMVSTVDRLESEDKYLPVRKKSRIKRANTNERKKKVILSSDEDYGSNK